MRLATFTSLLLTTNAFIVPGPKATFSRRVSLEASADDEVAALRAAAAKAREDAARLAKELGKDEASIAAPVVTKDEMSQEEVTSLVSEIGLGSGDWSQVEKLDELVSKGDFVMWKMAERDSKLRTFPVSLGFLESRTGAKVNADTLGLTGETEVSLDDFKYATLGVTVGCSALGVGALAFLPQNVGATVCYFLAVIPVLFLGVGSSAPGIIANAIASMKGTADDNDQRFERICNHEAGHFMAGYLCGLPIKGYSLLDSGVPCVEFHLSSTGDATSREFKAEEISALSVVAMSGSVAEILGCGDAKGGENDLIELQGFFRRSEEFIGAAKQQDLTRWGALIAYELLTSKKEKYDALVEAFKQKKSVEECVAILESR